MTAVAAAPRTFGSIRYDGSRRLWLLELDPHVAVMAKRIFSRAWQGRSAALQLDDTLDTVQAIDMLAYRYPLAMEPAARDRIADQLRVARERAEAIEQILSGRLTLGGDEWLEPALPPRDYQRQAADLVLSTGRSIVVDDLGLGKTFTGLLLLRSPDARPGLAVVPTHLQLQWRDELGTFFPTLRAHIVTSGTPYDPARTHEMRGYDPDLLVISYSKLAKWHDALRGNVKSVVFDEVQELRRHESMKYEAAAGIADQASYVMGLSATPVYNHGGEIFNIADVHEKGALGTREEFGREWGGADHRGRTMVRNPRALGTFLREQGLLLRRTRKDVGRELPEVMVVTHRVDSDTEHLDDVADQVAALADTILHSTDREETFKARGEIDWRLRKATGVAKAPHVATFARLLLESERKLVIAGWHRDVYELWLDQLREFSPVLYTGSESPKQKHDAATRFIGGPRLEKLRAEQRHKIDKWRWDDSCAAPHALAKQLGIEYHTAAQMDPWCESRILVLSLRSGSGLNGLQDVCRVAVFGELDWTPGVHDQVVGRLNRDGMDTSEPVVAYYCVSDEGSDPVVAEALGLKREQMEGIVNPDRELFTPTVDTGDRMRRLAEDVQRRRARRATDEGRLL